MTDLTPEQCQELQAERPTLRDPLTNQAYVLVRSDVYDRLKAGSEDGWAETTYRASMEAFAAGWDDPRMDVYDSLDPRKQP